MIPRPPSPHPSPEELYRARTADDEGARLAKEHAALCAECTEELAHLESFDRPDVPMREAEAAWPRFGEPSERPARRAGGLALWHPRVQRSLLAAAAAIALLAAASVWLARRPAADLGPLRSAPEAVRLVSPEGLLSDAPREFVFSGVQGPVRVMVFDAARNYSWTSEPVESDRVAFPDEERRRMQTGVEYSWTVLGEGIEVPVRTFLLIRPDP